MLVVEVVFWCAAALVLYAYLGYPLVLMAWHFVFRRQATQRDDSYRPRISLVMAAYNEEAFIRAKLENCLGLSYPPDKLEILIGSDGCEDRTNEIVEEFADRGVRLLAFNPRRGKMATINRVVKEATGDICIFSDVSEMFDQDALLKLVRHFHDPSVGIVAGNHIFNDRKTGIGVGTRVYRKFKRLCWRIESQVYSTCRCDGPIYACRRELYPFPSDSTINDDVAVPLGVLAQGRRVVFEPEAVIRGDVQDDTKVFFRQKIRCQAGRYQNLFQYLGMYRPWPLGRCWIFLSHIVLPTLVPWFMLTALVANGMLCFSGALLYQALFILHASFYVAAILGYVAEHIGLHFPAIAIPFYFVAANIGSLCGCMAYVFGMQRTTWRKLDKPDPISA